MKILETEHDIQNYTNEEIIRMGFALRGDALHAFNNRANHDELSAEVDELQSKVAELEEEIDDLQNQLNAQEIL